jgi:hypothetical protein
MDGKVCANDELYIFLSLSCFRSPHGKNTIAACMLDTGNATVEKMP